MDSLTIKRYPTPHFSARPAVTGINAIVIHDTGAHSLASTVNWLARPESKVSYHYVVDLDGSVAQFVDDEKKAWHAGKSILHGRANVNDFSIGVALVDENDRIPYPEPQLQAAATLTRALVNKYQIPLNRVVAHADVSPLRKVDPGPDFPWRIFLRRVAIG